MLVLRKLFEWNRQFFSLTTSFSPFEFLIRPRNLFCVFIFYFTGWMINFGIMLIYFPLLVKERLSNLIFSLLIGSLAFLVLVQFTLWIMKRTIIPSSPKRWDLRFVFLETSGSSQNNYQLFIKDIRRSFHSLGVILPEFLPIIFTYYSSVYGVLVHDFADFNGIVLDNISVHPLLLFWYLFIDPLWSSVIFSIIIWLFFIHFSFTYKLRLLSSSEYWSKLRVSELDSLYTQKNSLLDDHALVNSTHFYLYNFRKNTQSIASYSAWLTVIITVSIAVMTFWGIFVAFETLTRSGLIYVFLILVCVLFCAIFISFAFPQVMLHRIMDSCKTMSLHRIEQTIQSELSHYSNSTHSNFLTSSKDLQILLKDFERLDSLSTWAFNYSQIIIWIVGLGSFVISILQLFISIF